MARTGDVFRERRRSGAGLRLALLFPALLTAVAAGAAWYGRGEPGELPDVAGQVERTGAPAPTEASARLAFRHEMLQRIESLGAAVDRLTAAEERLAAFVSRLGDQVVRLEETIGDETAVPTAAAAPAPSEPGTPPAAAKSLGPRERERVVLYRVRGGETLWEIARSLTGSALNYRVLMEYNGLQQPEQLQAGQLLRIPPEYLVESERPGAPH